MKKIIQITTNEAFVFALTEDGCVHRATTYMAGNKKKWELFYNPQDDA